MNNKEIHEKVDRNHSDVGVAGGAKSYPIVVRAWNRGEVI